MVGVILEDLKTDDCDFEGTGDELIFGQGSHEGEYSRKNGKCNCETDNYPLISSSQARSFLSAIPARTSNR